LKEEFGEMEPETGHEFCKNTEAICTKGPGIRSFHITGRAENSVLSWIATDLMSGQF
jgi:hypothetical protein